MKPVIEDLYDVKAAQLGRGTRFAQKALSDVAAGVLRVQELDRDGGLEQRIESAPHLRRGARAEVRA